MYAQSRMTVQEEDRKTIVPTLIIGIGGTGLETILRVRRLIVESYGSLENFPIVGFLHIDTDKGAKPTNPLMAGPPLKDSEFYHSKVSLNEAQKIVNEPETYSWYHDWLPPELDPQLLASEEGAGQIRACGRFSFFFNHQKIGEACQQAKRKIRQGGHRDLMSTTYDLQVQNQVNVFVVGSIAGGTGSGMLIDLGYSLQRWFEGEPLQTTAIISMPDAFGSVSANDRVNCNGYAALMELNYFSDRNTTFSARYGVNEGSRIESKNPPYNFIYFVGTTNEYGVNIKLDDVREMIAQNIFLDLVSDFSPYKRSIRDNIKRAATGQNDKSSQGQSYPRNFMSFGLATIEIPIHHIRNGLASRLAADLCRWWQNPEVPLPVEPQTTVDAELRSINLLSDELRRTILRAKDRAYPYQAVIQEWLSHLREEIIAENRLECTAHSINFFSKEKGKIVNFIDGYLRPKVEQYRSEHFRDESPQERAHGDFLRVMHDNRDELVRAAISTLQEKLYSDLSDRSIGAKFLQLKLDLMEQRFESDSQQMEREAEKTWLVLEQAAWKEYEAALSRLNEFRLRWGLTKQSQMNKECDAALDHLGQALNCFLERKSRAIAAAVLRRMKEAITQLRSQLNRWQQQVSRSQAKFRERSEGEANQADALEIVGIKLFERSELNELYEDFLAHTANHQEGAMTSAAQRGLEILCQQLTDRVLSSSSPLWTESRQARATFRLLDIEKIPDTQYTDFESIVYQIAYGSILHPQQETKLYKDMDACTRFLREFPQETSQDAAIRRLFEQSQPLVQLDRNIPQAAEFNYIPSAKAGLLGGNNPTEPAAQKQAALLRKYFTAEAAIAPLTSREHHKVLAIHEIGGFSLRCLQGTKQMQRLYQDWRGRRVMAERAMLRGQQSDLPPSVHLQKDMVFWDFIPPDRNVEELVVIARALDILQEETNQKTQQRVIRYSTEIQGQPDRVTVAGNWEDAVQVLQLPDCGNDKKAIEGQVDCIVEAAETPQQKQQIQQRLESYLARRLRDFRKQGGEDNPRYSREKDILRDFMATFKLGTLDSSSPPNPEHPTEHSLGFQVEPPKPNSPTNNPEPSARMPTNTELPATPEAIQKFCGNCGVQLQPSVRFCTSCGHQVAT
jgi:Tubulin like/zinc-ribbon domain